ncbi:hypothetical protein SDRG_09965 [Saprolegnia diclina VS20]|uniref:Uncharacterized protein n=1 Tax=Saprolegnia diclina (strain VS20) TaxID=1156394 RepID=T0RIM5_SAPDV|nr:hypothetical protein SDRG_09965 [Saprolegnia diclina VS20]EQC32213.1 hypothetical protein SDRG_09965 [Saprolegnia diclina VS20]|eukprot:XP_008614154.1 hypothetical protein SDRG_09965 [Saprolegnia diclina VS20]
MQRRAWTRLLAALFNTAAMTVFYGLAVTKYIRTGDSINDVLGYNTATLLIHTRVLPFIDMDVVSGGYGMPISRQSLNLSTTGVSVRMRLGASTSTLNAMTTPGSATYFANMALATLGLNSSSLLTTPCGSSALLRSTTNMLAKPSPSATWSGINNLPTTIKATTNVAQMTQSILSDGRCQADLKLYHLEAFELWQRHMHTFNAFETTLRTTFVLHNNDTSSPASSDNKVVHWTFHPNEGDFNWFFYRAYDASYNAAALACQLVSMALLVTGFVRRVAYTTPNGARKMLVRYSTNLLAPQAAYYNSAIVNFLEIYMIVSNRFAFFRTVNALDFFMTAGWGFDAYLLYGNYINLMGSVFWVVLGMHKALSLLFYSIALVSQRTQLAKHKVSPGAMRRDSVWYDENGRVQTMPVKPPTLRQRSSSTLSSLQEHIYATGFQRTHVPRGLVLLKEIMRPRPDWIICCMAAWPSLYYAGFFNQATAWAPLAPINYSALGSRLGADMMLWNLVVCAIVTLPFNAIFVLWRCDALLSNGWVQLRKPGRAYYNEFALLRPNEKLEAAFEGQVDSVVLMVLLFRRHARERGVSVACCVSIHELLHDAVLSEFEAFYALFDPIDANYAAQCLVQHPAGPNPFERFPMVRVGSYRHRGTLLSWPRSHQPGIEPWDFEQMFLKRIYVVGADDVLIETPAQGPILPFGRSFRFAPGIDENEP